MVEKFLRIDPSGELSWIELERKPRHDDVYCGFEAVSVSDLHPVIGCNHVEMVRSIIPGIVFFVDECGKIKDPPQALNPLASRLYAGTVYGDPIVGPAVFFALRYTGTYFEKEIYPLNDHELSLLELALGIDLPLCN